MKTIRSIRHSKPELATRVFTLNIQEPADLVERIFTECVGPHQHKWFIGVHEHPVINTMRNYYKLNTEPIGYPLMNVYAFTRIEDLENHDGDVYDHKQDLLYTKEQWRSLVKIKRTQPTPPTRGYDFIQTQVQTTIDNLLKWKRYPKVSRNDLLKKYLVEQCNACVDNEDHIDLISDQIAQHTAPIVQSVVSFMNQRYNHVYLVFRRYGNLIIQDQNDYRIHTYLNHI